MKSLLVDGKKKTKQNKIEHQFFYRKYLFMLLHNSMLILFFIFNAVHRAIYCDRKPH